MNKKYLLAMSLIAVALLVSACSQAVTNEEGSDNQENTVQNEVPAPGFEDVEEMIVSDDNSDSTDNDTISTKSFIVSGENYKFDAKEIRVKEGDTVTIVFNNVGGFHDWTINEFNAQTKQISTGESDTITFVADKKGIFEYYCSVGQHRQLGMVGSLIVE